MTSDVEVIVVGAGVVGLAIARALAVRGKDVLVLERNAHIGMETSSRSSEVIHAGLYYPPGSLRAKLCVAGKEMLYPFAAENGVSVKRYGKLLVATEAGELPYLHRIVENAAKNGVNDLKPLSAADVRQLEPEVACIAAFLSPSTGVIDSHDLMQALEGHITSRGGSVVLETAVTRAEVTAKGEFRLDTTSGGEVSTITARQLINAAGHGASTLGAILHDGHGSYQPPATYPAKGHYFALSGRVPFQHLIYPMPSGAWLGVHLTLDVAGRAKFGPDIAWCDSVTYDFEDADGSRAARFYRDVRRFWPGLPDGALHPDYTGVRPKIYREGEPVPDFAIHGAAEHGIANLVGLYGIESPGLTASLAIGEHVADLLG